MQDLWVYLSEEPVFTDFANDEALVWHETSIPYAVWTPDSTRRTNLSYHLTESVQHNGTLYAHVFFARSGFSPDPESPEYVPSATFNRRHCKCHKYPISSTSSLFSWTLFGHRLFIVVGSDQSKAARCLGLDSQQHISFYSGKIIIDMCV